MQEHREPWAEHTVETPGQPDTGPAWPPLAPPFAPIRRPEYHRGVAQVGARRPTPLETTQEYGGQSASWHPGPEGVASRPPVSYRMRQLRRGGEWTWVGGLFAFICWGIWTVSVRGGSFVVPAVAFALVLLIAVGVFTLSRLLGRLILERGLGRVRRSAWGSHLVTGLFLGAAGVAYLGQTEWVVDAWNWVRGLS
jgi:hypothetical protein